MYKCDSVEGKLFYAVYTMCQQKKISLSQKGLLKDMIIKQDRDVYDQYYKCKDDYSTLEILLIELINESESWGREIQSPASSIFGCSRITVKRPNVTLEKSNFHKLSQTYSNKLIKFMTIQTPNLHRSFISTNIGDVSNSESP